MKKLTIFILVGILGFSIAGCKQDKAKPVLDKNVENTDTLNAGDSTVYGTMVDGGMNSLILVTDAGDTIEYLVNPDDTIEVVKGGKINGDKFAAVGYMEYGDRFIRKAINLTSLIGTWTSIDKNFDIKEGGAIVSHTEAERNPWTSWKIYNGKLVLSRDTFEVEELGADSLLLENKEGIFSFTRKK
ncbi:hypothetical protein [Prevotella dentasini]|uniref:hypothetical protein n=1 Tax=Prevotella dentasini TaxID=589537 RepID=UPI0004680F3C|nr:hypothetical protein [Prevotella dentasini]